MKPRWSAGVAAFAATVVVAGLGAVLSSTRAGRTEAYARDRAAQRRAATATRPAPPPAPVVPMPGKEGPGCVTGVDTFAVAVERSLVPLPAGRQRRVAALRQLSSEAIRAERSAEPARPAPTLPRRMGVSAGQPVTPEKRACDGKGYAELR